jgi:hypothetical protein
MVLNDSDILSGEKWAYTNIIGLAKSKAAFRNQAKRKLHSMDLKLVRLEGAEPFIDRINNYEVDKEIIIIARRLSPTNTIDFATFHTYPEEKNSN